MQQGIPNEGDDMGRVQDKVALVTGAAQGIGRATAQLLAREGAAVAVADVNAKEAEAVAEQIRAAGGKARAWQLDVSQEAEVAAVLAAIGQEFGRLDILVNNAGISGANGTAEEITEAEWDKVMNVNAKGTFLCTKHAVPLMRRAGGGSIVNLSSVYGIVGSHNVAAYHASKGAIRIMSKTDALAFAEDRIRVNSVHPGFIWTPMLEAGAQVPGVAPEAVHSAMAKLHPLGTLGEPDDVAHGILYLASDEAKFVTGSELVIDGGYTAR
jgi:NAD(P)-dependent dehydrogenase (short-subunit alcohol dehydrogenase family)